MKKHKNITRNCASILAVGSVLLSGNAFASDNEIDQLRKEMQELQKIYQEKIDSLEKKIESIEANQKKSQQTKPNTGENGINVQENIDYFEPLRRSADNAFNPAVSVVLDSKYFDFSQEISEIESFAVGHEAERPHAGFNIGHTEMTLSSNIDDKFFGSTTIALAEHEGNVEVEIEEAYIQILPGFELFKDLNVKMGRAYWTLGYLNDIHLHAHDFADLSLVNRIMLNGGYNDDGIEVSYILPTDFYAEIGGGIFNAGDFPFNSHDKKSYSLFARIGGDIGIGQSWRVGAYMLSADQNERITNDDNLLFAGDTSMFVTDFKYVWAPSGNSKLRELIIQGEYFKKEDNGIFYDLFSDTAWLDYKGSDEGYYLQSVYKLNQNWRVGGRYSEISGNLPTLESDIFDHKIDALSFMVDWTNSEFSRFRLQLNQENFEEYTDDQIIFQYIMSIGAHGAHKY